MNGIWASAREGKLDELKAYDGDWNVVDPIGGTPLTWAVAENHLECAEYMLIKGANANHIHHMGSTPWRSLLLLAVSMRKPSLVSLLLRHGANTEQEDENGHTALYNACNFKNMYPHIICLLLRFGARMSSAIEYHNHYEIFHCKRYAHQHALIVFGIAKHRLPQHKDVYKMIAKIVAQNY